MTSINTNVGALNARLYAVNATSKQQTAMERLSSGLRVNSAADDAAESTAAAQEQRMNTDSGTGGSDASSGILTREVPGGRLRARQSTEGLGLSETCPSVEKPWASQLLQSPS